LKTSELVTLITLKEDGKSKVKVGDAREIVAILSDEVWTEFQAMGYKEVPKLPILKVLYLNGKKRSKKAKPVEPIKES
jgi:hypothetical protein